MRLHLFSPFEVAPFKCFVFQFRIWIEQALNPGGWCPEVKALPFVYPTLYDLQWQQKAIHFNYGTSPGRGRGSWADGERSRRCDAFIPSGDKHSSFCVISLFNPVSLDAVKCRCTSESKAFHLAVPLCSSVYGLKAAGTEPSPRRLGACATFLGCFDVIGMDKWSEKRNDGKWSRIWLLNMFKLN